MAIGKELASWQQDLAIHAKQVAHNEGSDSSAITIQHGRMMYHDQEVPGNSLDVIIVASTAENCYYDGPYDPDKVSSPACFSMSLDPHDMVPHENVVNPVSASCNGCPNNEFGSKGKGKACKNYRKLIMIPANTQPEDVAKAELAYVKVSPTSVNNWKKYAQQLVASAGIPPWAASTRIKVVPDKKTIHQVLFEGIAPLEDSSLLSAIHARIEEAEQMLLRPYTYDEDTTDQSSAKY